jgi:hypothetical protein
MVIRALKHVVDTVVVCFALQGPNHGCRLLPAPLTVEQVRPPCANPIPDSLVNSILIALFASFHGANS